MLDFLQTYGYIGLFLLLILEEGGIPLPIPGDIFIAFVASFPKTNYFLIVTTIVSATLIGSTILFYLSKKFGDKILKKYGRFIKVTPKKIAKMEKWFEKYGGLAIVVGRLIPGLRIITPLVAGTFKVSYRSFWIYTALAAFIWANVYFFIGKFFEDLVQNLRLF